MRSDHLAKHVKTHNGTTQAGAAKKGSSESCSDSEEQNTNELNQSSPSHNNNQTSHNNNSSSLSSQTMDGSVGLHGVQHHHHQNTMVLTPHQINVNAPLIHHHQTHHHQHTPSPGLDHVNQLDIKPGIV
jgi:hypothetical protein